MSALLIATAAVALAAGGGLDTTFGSNGVGFTDGGSFLGEIAVQADGRTVAGGARPTGVTVDGVGTTEWVLRRVDASGALDTGYGTSGLVRMFGESGADALWDLDIDSSGRVVAAGETTVRTAKGKGKSQQIARTAYATLVRRTTAGALDTSFGSGGVVRVTVPGSTFSRGRAMTIQPDGKILIAGLTGIGYQADGGGIAISGVYPFVARFSSNGAIDPSFGASGYAVDTRVPLSQSVHAIALQSTGGVVEWPHRLARRTKEVAALLGLPAGR